MLLTVLLCISFASTIANLLSQAWAHNFALEMNKANAIEDPALKTAKVQDIQKRMISQGCFFVLAHINNIVVEIMMIIDPQFRLFGIAGLFFSVVGSIKVNTSKVLAPAQLIRKRVYHIIITLLHLGIYGYPLGKLINIW